MEEAGNEWSCPKCKTKEEKENTAQLKDKMKERAQNRLEYTWNRFHILLKNTVFFCLGGDFVGRHRINSISRICRVK